MIKLDHIHSVTDFQRNPKAILAQIRDSGLPAILTVNGRPEMIVQDAASYQELLDKVEEALDLEAIREGLAQSLEGHGRSASSFFAEFEASRGLPPNG